MINLIRAAAFVMFLPSLGVAQTPREARRDVFEILVQGKRGNVKLDTLARWEEVTAPHSKTFDAVTRVLKHHVKLRIEHTDTIGDVVYNTKHIASGKLAGQPMSRWLRCGVGMTGDHADWWRITLSYAVYVAPAATDRSRLGVAVYATGQSPDGSSTARVPCASTGALEREIIDKVREVVQTL